LTNEPARQKTGLWKPWKNKLRFPTVPTAPTAAKQIKMKKAATLKQKKIVYTKRLTDPPLALLSKAPARSRHLSDPSLIQLYCLLNHFIPVAAFSPTV